MVPGHQGLHKDWHTVAVKSYFLRTQCTFEGMNGTVRREKREVRKWEGEEWNSPQPWMALP